MAIICRLTLPTELQSSNIGRMTDSDSPARRVVVLRTRRPDPRLIGPSEVLSTANRLRPGAYAIKILARAAGTLPTLGALQPDNQARRRRVQRPDRHAIKRRSGLVGAAFPLTMTWNLGQPHAT